MNLESFQRYCLGKPGVTETSPFGDNTLVYKVMDKMFALAILLPIPVRINLKCDPEKAIELREKYDSVLPGYHMNKKYWNTVVMDNTIPDKDLLLWIDESYNLVAASLKKGDREKLMKMF